MTTDPQQQTPTPTDEPWPRERTATIHADSETVYPVIGVAWYRRKYWDRLLRMFPDREIMQDSFDDWLRDAENATRQMQTQGMIAEHIIIDPDELRTWCEATGVPPNAEARARYVTEKLRQADAGCIAPQR